MSTWDDDFWSDDELAEALPASTTSTQSVPIVNEDNDAAFSAIPVIPSLEIPTASLSPTSPVDTAHIGTTTADAVHEHPAWRTTSNRKSLESISPVGLNPISNRSSQSRQESSGWGWSNIAATAADFILAPEEGPKATLNVQPMDIPPPSIQYPPPVSDNDTQNSWLSSLKSVAFVLEDVRATAGQSGREIFQAATDVLDSVKKPSMRSESHPVLLSPLSESNFPREDLATIETAPMESLIQGFDSTLFAGADNAPASDSSIPLPPSIYPDDAKRFDPGSEDSFPSPLGSHPNISSSLQEQNEPNPDAGQSIQNDDSLHTFKSSSDQSPIAISDPSSSGWLQGMFEDVRISAAQSGREILQVSGEVLQNARKIVPIIQTQEALHDDPTSQSSLSLSSSSWSRNQRYSTSPSGGYDNYQASPVSVARDLNLTQTHDHPASVLSEPAAILYFAGRDEPIANDTSSMSELTNFLRGQENDVDAASFDDMFSECGGCDTLSQLEKMGRDQFVFVQRKIPLLGDLLVRSQLNEIKGVLMGSDRRQSPPETPSSSNPFNINRILMPALAVHKKTLVNAVPSKADGAIGILCKWICCICTRTLAFLAMESVIILHDFAKRCRDDACDLIASAQDVDALRQQFRKACGDLTSLSVQAARQLCPSDEFQDDIELLHADIDVEIFEAESRVEDAIEALVPILQSIVLSR